MVSVLEEISASIARRRATPGSKFPAAKDFRRSPKIGLLDGRLTGQRQVLKNAAFANHQPERDSVRFGRYSLQKPGANALRLIEPGAVHLTNAFPRFPACPEWTR